MPKALSNAVGTTSGDENGIKFHGGLLWVMFYFGAFWEGRKDAFNRFACSYNLVDWTDWKGEDLIKPSTSFDSKYAHKPFVVKWNGVVYHFYNAVDDKENRAIAVATSVDLTFKK